MAMTSMKLTAEEAKTADGPVNAPDSGNSGPTYPYGLSISLNDESLKKLGIDSLPDVGTTMTLSAKVEVVSLSKYENQDGKDISLSLQITDMELLGDGPDAATVLFGGS